jgi:hypothetical protein
MDEEVFQFTAQHFGAKRESLSARTCPWPDLCQDERQNAASLRQFSQRFGVPFSRLNNHHAAVYFVRCLAAFVFTGITSTVGILGLGVSDWKTGSWFYDHFLDPRLFPWITLGDLAASATLAARHRESSGTRPHTAG